MTKKKQVRALAEIASRLSDGALDGSVLIVANEIAAQINKAGVDAQLEYLLATFSFEELKKIIQLEGVDA